MNKTVEILSGLKSLSLSVPAIIFTFAAIGNPEPAKEKQIGRPNIVIILADDQGNADAGFQRSPSTISTPSIDKLAESGVVFFRRLCQCLRLCANQGGFAYRPLPATVWFLYCQRFKGRNAIK
jgi:hypothetical protein